jgi:hypothetical protein
MIDTVAGKLEKGPYVPSDPSRNQWITSEKDFFDARKDSRERTIMHTLNSPEARILIYGDNGGIRIEASLPKLLYGNNLSRVSDPVPALQLLREFVSDHVTGAIPNLLEFEYTRADYCHNFQVGFALRDYIHTLGELTYLKHNRTTDGFGAVEWWNQSRRIRAYDKWREIKDKEKLDVPAAKGVLRFELELKKKSGFIERRLRQKHLTFRDVLAPAVAYRFLDEALTKMCLNADFITHDQAKDVLDLNCTYVKATRLLGILRRLEYGSMQDVKALSSRSSFYSDRKSLRDFGLWPPSSTRIALAGLRLPPLGDLLSNLFVPSDAAR